MARIAKLKKSDTTPEPAKYQPPRYPVHTFPDWPIRNPGDMRGLAVSDIDFRVPSRYSKAYVLVVNEFGNGELLETDPNVATRRRYAVLTKEQVAAIVEVIDSTRKPHAVPDAVPDTPA